MSYLQKKKVETVSTTSEDEDAEDGEGDEVVSHA